MAISKSGTISHVVTWCDIAKDGRHVTCDFEFHGDVKLSLYVRDGGRRNKNSFKKFTWYGTNGCR